MIKASELRNNWLYKVTLELKELKEGKERGMLDSVGLVAD